MTAYDRRLLRILAIAQLVTLGGAVLSILLTLAFPRFAIFTASTCYICLSPQIVLALLLTPTALVLTFATSISSLRQSHRAGQARWAAIFTAVFLLLIPGLTYLICIIIAPFTTPQNTLASWILVGGTAVVSVLTAICALVYASRGAWPKGSERAEDDRAG